MDEWATIEFSFQNVKRGVLRASRSAWAEELFSLIHFSFYFLDGRTSTPSQGIFQFQPPSNHRKDTKTSKKNILSSPPLKISEFLLEKSRKSRKIKKKQEFYEERKIEKIMRLLLLQGIILVSSQEVRSSVQSLNGIF